MKKAKDASLPGSESEVLKVITGVLPKPSSEVLTGIGDDCAVIRQRQGSKRQLLKADALVEGIHYAPGTSLSKVGWKALCRPISDIAAMGGTPLHALVTVAAPPDWSRSDWKQLYRGIDRAARQFDVSVVGGETVRSSGGAFLSVTLTGEIESRHVRLRSGARSGDLLCVTHRLGGSLRSGRHLSFLPRLAEGQWLGKQSPVTAMMDLSDGLGTDLPKLAAASRLSFHLDPSALPRHPGCSVEQAISDGEDYELLITVSPSGWPSLNRSWGRRFPGLSLTLIGEMLPKHLPSTPLSPGHDHLHRTTP